MEFRESTVSIDGDEYRLRELSGLAVDLAGRQAGDTRQGYALVALSLIGETDALLYSESTLDEGVAWVMGLPTRVSRQLSDAVAALNADELDDARKN